MLHGEIKIGDRLLWKPGTPEFKRVRVDKISGNNVYLVGTHWDLSVPLEIMRENCERADLDTGIKPL
jgi:hypothetical protein